METANINTPNPYDVPYNPKPCPSCGRCPCCGKGPQDYWVRYPWWDNQPYQPYTPPNPWSYPTVTYSYHNGPAPKGL